MSQVVISTALLARVVNFIEDIVSEYPLTQKDEDLGFDLIDELEEL